MNDKIIKLSENSDEHVESLVNKINKLNESVIITEHNIVFKKSQREIYSIPKSECQTCRSILRKVQHLTEKTWMSCDLIQVFVRKACEENKLKLYD